MAEIHSTESPPLDRDAFGHWLAGFADGEGSFFLGYARARGRGTASPHARFQILLRADDLPILLDIQSHLACGRLYVYDREKRRAAGHSTSENSATFSVGNILDLAEIVVPHFDRYPLRAERRDYRICAKPCCCCEGWSVCPANRPSGLTAGRASFVPRPRGRPKNGDNLTACIWTSRPCVSINLPSSLAP